LKASRIAPRVEDVVDVGKLVEVPGPAFDAVLDLLGDLLDIELEDEVCPICSSDGSHDDDCPIGRASLVRDALDYREPQRQARALVALEAGGAG
jgi:hypothetical protein